MSNLVNNNFLYRPNTELIKNKTIKRKKINESKNHRHMYTNTKQRYFTSVTLLIPVANKHTIELKRERFYK